MGSHGREIESLRDFKDGVVGGIFFPVVIDGDGDRDHTKV